MKELPVELVVDILSRLPLKPLIRFRCVSKAWLQLFTLDPQFAKLHYDRLIQTNLGILDWPAYMEDPLRLALDGTSCQDVIRFHFPFNDSQSPFYDNDEIYDENSYRLFGICNGLLAIVPKYFGDLYIWNPLTKDYIKMSPPPTPDSQPSRTYGFGYDQSTDEYKVIGVHYYFDTKQGDAFRSQVNVFTLGVDSSWRIVEEDINLYILDLFPRISSLVNGVIHWIAQRPYASSLHIIAGFDLRDEVFREIELPSDMNLDDGRKFADICEMGGLLCIFSQSGIFSQSESFLEIWMMKEYGVFDSWTKLLKFDKRETGFLGETGVFGDLRPMGFAQNGDVILMWKQRTVYLCNPETKATRILGQFDDRIFTPYAYVGSIISPKVISRVGLSLEEEET